MLVKGWKTGTPDMRTGSGFGLKISLADRAAFFKHNWKSVEIELSPGQSFTVNLSRAFWGRCPELRSKWLGRWMIDKGLAPWRRSSPPTLRLEPIGDGHFRLDIV